MVNAAA